MKSTVLTWAGVGVFVLIVFAAGVTGGVAMTTHSGWASHTHEHVANGQISLLAL